MISVFLRIRFLCIMIVIVVCINVVFCTNKRLMYVIFVAVLKLKRVALFIFVNNFICLIKI